MDDCLINLITQPHSNGKDYVNLLGFFSSLVFTQLGQFENHV